jgi:hypothetical protein
MQRERARIEHVGPAMFLWKAPLAKETLSDPETPKEGRPQPLPGSPYRSPGRRRQTWNLSVALAWK